MTRSWPCLGCDTLIEQTEQRPGRWVPLICGACKATNKAAAKAWMAYKRAITTERGQA